MNITKTTTYDIGDKSPSLGHTHKYGGVKAVNGRPNTPSLGNWIPTVNTYTRYDQMIKKIRTERIVTIIDEITKFMT
jgi:hypothetical protein